MSRWAVWARMGALTVLGAACDLQSSTEGRVDIDDLGGHDLDSTVARLVFGLEVEDRTDARTRERSSACRGSGRDWNRVAHIAGSLTGSGFQQAK